MQNPKFFDANFQYEDSFELEEEEKFSFEEPDLLLDSPDLFELDDDFSEFNKMNNNPFVYLFIDSEFTDSTFLSFQLYGFYFFNKQKIDFSYIVFNKKYSLHINENIIFPRKNYFKKKKIHVYFSDFLENENLISEYLSYYLEKNIFFKRFQKSLNRIRIFVFFYFSWKDLISGFGIENLRPYMVGKNSKGKIYQRRNITGTFPLELFFEKKFYTTKVILKDLFGLNSFGLKNLIKSSGLSDEFLKGKDLLDEYKTRMDEALILFPETFFEYSMNDAFALSAIVFSQIKSFNKIMKDVFHIKDQRYYFHILNFPISLGSLVHKMFLSYFYYIILKNSDIYQIAFFKGSILNEFSKNYMNVRDLFFNLQQIHSLDELFKSDPLKKFDIFFKRNVFKFTLMEYNSIRWLLENSINNTLYTLSVTTGGRTNNERPESFFTKYGADVDISSAYGSELKKLIFPLGRPRFFMKSSNTTNKILLGDFMNKKNMNFSDFQMFKIVVSGKLSFEQDLIISKVSSESTANEKISNYYKLERDKQVIPTSFVLLRKEIINGIVTYKTWDILRKVCTTSEFNEISNLEVVSAMYYNDEDLTENLEEFLNTLLNDKGSYSFDEKNNAVIDTRTYKTYYFPLKNFIEPILEKRLELKKSKNPEDQAYQISLKYVINTLWGLLTSPFFQINNVLLSEIVSNNTRISVWLMSKPLNTFMSITDGGPYCLNEVFSFRNTLQKMKKPGLESLSSFQNRKNHKSLSLNPLGNINWSEYFENNVSPFEFPFTKLDHLAQETVYNFWKNYQIDFEAKLEHKIENTFFKGVFLLKANYAFKIYSNSTKTFSEKIFVIRGFRKNEDLNEFFYPIYTIFNDLLDCKNPEDYTYKIQKENFYKIQKIIKLNSWKKTLVEIKSNFFKSKEKNQNGKELLPGDSIIDLKQFRFNNTWFFIDNYKEYSKRNRRSLRYEIKKKYEQEIKYRKPLFEKYFEKEQIKISHLIKKMQKDDL